MPEAMQDSVNPTDFDWYAASRGLNLSDLRTTWEKMLVTEIPHSDSTKKIGNLKDDLQVLFVSLLLEHADHVFPMLGSQETAETLASIPFGYCRYW